ncbi:MAG: Hpt domain-containing protein, partial [Candidatus Riflebacteria bacterium]
MSPTDKNIHQILVKEFQCESGEHVEILEQSFLSFEKNDGNGEKTIREAFRAIHSLKGSAACLGFRNIAEVAHRMEHLMSQVREKKLVPDGALIDLMLRGVDKLRFLLGDLAGSDKKDCGEICKQLENFVVAKVEKPVQKAESKADCAIAGQAIPDES